MRKNRITNLQEFADNISVTQAKRMLAKFSKSQNPNAGKLKAKDADKKRKSKRKAAKKARRKNRG